ncbi:Polyketide synthase PksJ [Methylobacterium bullatum]|uniref:Polyketide synthase PksJ n=1 Tax=Methylobacterium bullatum TaxID=570505 RepID=A0A679JB44_9HYPH|nr:Polyketide synthase PksJ [Methylobacterium bullatum]
MIEAGIDRYATETVLREIIERFGLYDACVFETSEGEICAVAGEHAEAVPTDRIEKVFFTAGRTVAVLPLRRVPRGDDGMPDLGRLRAAWAERSAISDAQPAELVHLWHLGLAPGKPSVAPSVQTSSTHRSDGPPSILRGPPLVIPAGTPTTLPELLSVCSNGEKSFTWIDRRGSARDVSYADLLARAQAVAASLRRRGARRGERIMIVGPDGIDVFTALWGCLWAGLVACPVATPKRIAADDGDVTRLAMLARRLDIRWVLTSAGTDSTAFEEALLGTACCLDAGTLAKTGRRAFEPMEPVCSDEVALLFLTSGSTGLPKATMLTHANLLSMAEGIRQRHRFSAGDTVLNWMPLEHIGVQGMLATVALVTGASQIHVETSYVLADPLRWLDLIDRYRIAYGWAPHFAFALIGDAAESARMRDWDLSCVKRLLNAGEVVFAGGVRRFLQVAEPYGLRAEAVGPSWGMSETSSSFLLAEGVDPDLLQRDPHAPLDVGTPHPGGEARLVDPDGGVVPEGEEGRLEVRGPQVNVGYDGDPDATAASRDTEGWFRTGDRGRIVGGRMVITGRDKDVVILRGQNFSQQALESVAEAVDAVSTSFVAAVGVPDNADGTEALAILYHAEPDTAETRAAIREGLRQAFGVTPNYLVPLAQDEFPKTAIGKIQRSALRARFVAGDFRQRIVARDLCEAGSRTLPAWFFIPRWYPLDRYSAQVGTKKTIIFDDDPAPAEIARLCAELARQGGDATIVVPGRDGTARPDDVPRPGGRGLAAALRCLLAETEGVRIRLLHVPALQAAEQAKAERLAACVPFADSRTSMRMEAIAHGDRLWGYGISPMPKVDASTMPIFPTDAGFVLLVGGGGRIGPHVAHRLRAGFGLPVLITSRGRSSGGAHEVVMDPTDRASVRAALAEGTRRFGGRAGAIVHLGGSTRINVPLATESEASFKDHFRGKPESALVLRDALEETGGGLLVLFSSVNADFGGFGAGAYAAANAALRPAMLERSVPGVRVLLLAWSLWATEDVAFTEGTRPRGFRSLPPDQAALSMEVAIRVALHHDLDAIVVGLDGAHPGIAQLLDCGALLPTWTATRNETVLSQAFDEVEIEVAIAWRTILGRENVRPTDSFFDLGGNSLLLARLHERLTHAFDAEFSLGELFRRTTIRDQAGLFRSSYKVTH